MAKLEGRKDVERLIKALEHRESIVRREASEAPGKKGDVWTNDKVDSGTIMKGR